MSKKDPFLISDTHFFHDNILKFCRPQFNSVEEMNELMIKNWNDVVGVNDRVYMCGDFAFKSRYDVFNRLNGDIILILGNHEYVNKTKSIVEDYPHVRVVGSCEFGGGIITHIPVHESQLERWKFNIHGHLHDDLIDDIRYMNVCVETIGFKPVRFSELIKIQKERFPYKEDPECPCDVMHELNG
jgi:calcineurin-like phosphoesterase family protein